MGLQLGNRIVALRGWRAVGAPFAAGLLTALALPPLYVLPTLLVGFPVLLCLIEGARNPWVAARRGWWFGFGLHLVGLYWITEAILMEGTRFWWLVPFAVPGVSAILAGFVACATAMAWRARPGWRASVTLAGAWVLTDLARQFVATGFPWNLLGSVWEFPGRLGDIMIQPAALVGAHGLTLATVLLASLPLLGWAWRVGGLVLLLSWFIFGLVRIDE